jgi:hypothetical protein
MARENIERRKSRVERLEGLKGLGDMQLISSSKERDRKKINSAKGKRWQVG